MSRSKNGLQPKLIKYAVIIGANAPNQSFKRKRVLRDNIGTLVYLSSNARAHIIMNCTVWMSIFLIDQFRLKESTSKLQIIIFIRAQS